MGEPDPYAIATEIRVLSGMLLKISKQELERHIEAQGAGISGLQYGALVVLSSDNYTLSELGHKMHLHPSTLVPVVDALERAELVERGRDPNDRRRTPISLTAGGRELLSLVPYSGCDDSLSRSLMDMGEDKSRELLALLREIVSRLTDEDTVSEVSATIHRMFERTNARNAG